MLFLKIVCWAYLVWTILGRIVNCDKNDEQSIKVRCVDNITIIIFIMIIYFLNK